MRAETESADAFLGCLLDKPCSSPHDSRVESTEERSPEIAGIDAWVESLESVVRERGAAVAGRLLARLLAQGARLGIGIAAPLNTPYVNTIPVHDQPPLPTTRAIAQRLTRLTRWNAMAIVVQANRVESGIGGHISSYASATTLIEVGQNHFFRGPDAPGGGDQVFFQGHAAPGVYARAFL